MGKTTSGSCLGARISLLNLSLSLSLSKNVPRKDLTAGRQDRRPRAVGVWVGGGGTAKKKKNSIDTNVVLLSVVGARAAWSQEEKSGIVVRGGWGHARAAFWGSKVFWGEGRGGVPGGPAVSASGARRGAGTKNGSFFSWVEERPMGK